MDISLRIPTELYNILQSTDDVVVNNILGYMVSQTDPLSAITSITRMMDSYKNPSIDDYIHMGYQVKDVDEQKEYIESPDSQWYIDNGFYDESEESDEISELSDDFFIYQDKDVDEDYSYDSDY